MGKTKSLTLTEVIYIIYGSSIGVLLRLYIIRKFKKFLGFNINSIALINIVSSFIVGFLIALDIKNKDLLLLFFTGFLGCFSTFSSYVYTLFVLVKERKYIDFLAHYLLVIVFSFLFFMLGYYLIELN